MGVVIIGVKWIMIIVAFIVAGLIGLVTFGIAGFFVMPISLLNGKLPLGLGKFKNPFLKKDKL